MVRIWLVVLTLALVGIVVCGTSPGSVEVEGFASLALGSGGVVLAGTSHGQLSIQLQLQGGASASKAVTSEVRLSCAGHIIPILAIVLAMAILVGVS